MSKEVFVMRKRLLAALLSAVLLLTLVPAAFAASDLDGHWAKKYIDYLADEDIINPSATTGKYQPDTKVTRAEFMRYINRAFHFTETASISYTDVPKSAWYYETVCIAQKYGYINGVGGGRMGPTGTVTREQAATIIGRLYKADPGNVSPASLDFKDKAKISSWSAGYIRAAVDKGFLAGYSDGTFRPTREVTRGEVAKIIYYYLGTSLSRAGKAYTGADLRGDTTNATISESCTLSDATIEGDLFITEGLGTDAVTLSNVTVEGTIIISGGTVTMTNTTSDHIIVSSAMGRLLQTTATGASRFSEAEVRTAAVLYEKVLTDGYDGFENVTVCGGNKVSLTVDADLLKLTVNAPVTVTTTAAAKVYHFQANRAATVTGYGSVYQADVRTDGVSFTKDVALGGYTLASGVSVSVAGENRTASSTAAVSPSSVILDLGDEESLADGVEFSLPSGVTAEKLLLDSSELTGTAFETTSRGLRVKADTLKTLSIGSHTLTFRLSDGQTATVMVSATRETAAQPVQTAAFDRYYRSTNFRDISVKLEGVNAKSDIAKVVLGLTPLSYEFDEASRTLTLRRAALAQLPERHLYRDRRDAERRQRAGGRPDGQRHDPGRRQCAHGILSERVSGGGALCGAHAGQERAQHHGRAGRPRVYAERRHGLLRCLGRHFARGECARAVRDLGRVHGLYGGALGQFHLAARGGLHLKEAGRARSLRCSASGREMSLHFIRFSSKL